MARTKELFRHMLSIFDKLILPTHASCHVQYVLFYLCSFRLVRLTLGPAQYPTGLIQSQAFFCFGSTHA